jgi:hypothetical protein
MKFKIDPEFRDLLPPLTADEYRRLSAKIELETRAELVVAVVQGERFLVDGHNTLRVCQEKGLRYTVREVKLPTRELAIEWIVNNQLARRNLTDDARAYFIGRKYLERKKAEGRPAGGAEKLGNTCPVPGNTAEAVAEEQGVSPRTVKNDATFAAAVDAAAEAHGPEAKAQILSGDSGQSRASIVNNGLILCKRCRRAGPAKDCAACLEARAKQTRTTRAAPTSPPRARPAKNGEESYNPRLVGECFGRVVAQLDRLAKDHGCCSARGVVRETPAYLAIRRKITEVQKDIADWRKQLQKGKP